MNRRLRFTAFLLPLMFVLSAHAQDDNCVLWEKNTATVAPECLSMYGLRVYEQVEKLHHCFRVLSNFEKAPRIKRAAKTTALDLFRDRSGQNTDKVRYFGFVLDNNNEFALQSRDLDTYIEMLLARDSTEQYNICWGIPAWEGQSSGSAPSYAVEFKPGVSNAIEKTGIGADTVQRYFKVYNASMPIKEVIAFRRTLTYEKEVCKEISFQLRFVRRIDTSDVSDGAGMYYWQASFYEIKESKVPNACKVIKEVVCPIDTIKIIDTIISPPPPPRDCKRLVPLWTYAVPGTGFQYLRESKKGLTVWPLITVAWGGTAATAGYYKIRSDNSYRKHLNGTILQERDDFYDRAKSDHDRFLYFAGASALIWAVSDLTIFFKDTNQNKKCKRNFELNKATTAPTSSMSIRPTMFPDPLSGSNAIGIKMSFQLY